MELFDDHVFICGVLPLLDPCALTMLEGTCKTTRTAVATFAGWRKMVRKTKKRACWSLYAPFHKAMAEYLTGASIPGCTKAVMDEAAKNGHLDVVKWLHTNRTEGCTEKAMNMAAENGHLDVVEFLHPNRTEGCTLEAICSAASNGRFDVALWLFANRKDGA